MTSTIIHLLLIFSYVNDVFGSSLSWAVRLSHKSHHSVASEVGLRSSGPVNELLRDVYEFKLDDEDHVKLLHELKSHQRVIDHVHSLVVSHPHVKWAEHQHSLSRQKRQIYFNDPSFPHQWHLVSHVMVMWLDCDGHVISYRLTIKRLVMILMSLKFG